MFVAFSSSFSATFEDLLKNKSQIDLFPVEKKKKIAPMIYSQWLLRSQDVRPWKFLFPKQATSPYSTNPFYSFKMEYSA